MISQTRVRKIIDGSFQLQQYRCQVLLYREGNQVLNVEHKVAYSGIVNQPHAFPPGSIQVIQDRKHLLKGEIYERWLTSKISRCNSLSDLQMMVLEDGWQFCPINLSAAFVRVTRLEEKNPGQVTSIMAKLSGFLTAEVIERMNPQSLANTVWAMAKTQYGCSPEGQSILKALVLQCEACANIFSSQNISNVVWGMAKCGLRDEIAVRSLSMAALEKREFLNPQEVSNILWAMSTLKFVDEELLRRLLAIANDKLQSFNSQNIGNTAWTMGNLRYYDEDFLDGLSDIILNEDDINTNFKNDFSSVAAIQVLGACANLNYVSKPLLRWMLHKTGAPNKLSLQGLVNIMFYWAMLDQPLLAIQQVCAEILHRYKKNSMNFHDVHYRQFWFASALFNSKLEVVNMPEQLRAVSQARWKDVMENPMASEESLERVKDISETLRELGFRSIINYCIRERPVRADLAINVKGSNIAIFVNGPLRYTNSQPIRKLGILLARQRLAQSAEWKIMDIPWYEYNNLYDTSSKEEYLEKKMMQVLTDEDD